MPPASAGNANQIEILDYILDGLQEAGAGRAIEYHVVHGQGELHKITVFDIALLVPDWPQERLADARMATCGAL